MKTTNRIHREANTPTTQPDEKDQLILLLQEQLLLTQQDREVMEALLREQDRIIIRQHQHLCEKDQQLSRQQQTILQQAELLSQYDQLINKQKDQISVQHQQLDKQGKELWKLDMVRHELRIVKKWLYGIKVRNGMLIVILSPVV